MFYGAVVLRINATIYCANFKFASQYIVYKFLSATAPFLFYIGDYLADALKVTIYLFYLTVTINCFPLYHGNILKIFGIFKHI